MTPSPTRKTLTNLEIEPLHRSMVEVNTPREHQLAALVQAGASPAQAVGAVRHEDDPITTLCVLGLYSLLAFRGGWEAARELALALDIHPLGFATGWVPDLQEAEVLDLLGLRDRFVAYQAVAESGDGRNRPIGELISGVKLGTPLKQEDPDEDSLWVESCDAGFGSLGRPSAEESRVDGSAEGPASGNLVRKALIIHEPLDLCLRGNPLRMKSLWVRGRFVESRLPQ